MTDDEPESYADWLRRMTPTAEDREVARQNGWVAVGRHTWRVPGVTRNAVTNRYVVKDV